MRFARLVARSTTGDRMNNITKTWAIAALLASANALAADSTPTDPGRAQYEAERARCMSDTTGQDQASCLRSAGAAYDAMREGRLRDPNTDYTANAMTRCAALPPSDRADCEARVNGEGAKSGSVSGGGDIKETVTTVPASSR